MNFTRGQQDHDIDAMFDHRRHCTVISLNSSYLSELKNKSLNATSPLRTPVFIQFREGVGIILQFSYG